MAEKSQQDEFEDFQKKEESKQEKVETDNQKSLSSPEKTQIQEQNSSLPLQEQNIPQPQEQEQEQASDNKEKIKNAAQDITPQQWIEKANEIKNIGNNYYKQNQFQDALQTYVQGIKHVFEFKRQFLDFKDQQILKELEGLKIVFQNNASQYAAEIAEEVLKFDPQNLKAMMRKSEAIIEMGQYEEAIQILKTANQIQPSNTTIRKLYEDAMKLKKQALEKEKEMFGGKFIKQDTQKKSPQKQQLISQKEESEQSSGKWLKFFTIATGLAATGFFVYNRFKASKQKAQ